jgi:hypothetical protein
MVSDIVFDYSKLRGKIREVFFRQGEFAKALEISDTALSLKLNNHSEFTQTEINKACVLLGVEPDAIHDYFFRQKVQERER